MAKKKTNYHYFDGTALYTMTKVPNAYGNYTVKLEMDEDSMAEFLASGIQLEVKDNAVFFKRPHQKIINDELVVLGPPSVVAMDGVTAVDDLIGTGSKVTVKVTSFDTLKGVGHTLQAIQVKELVPVEGRKNF